MLFSFETLRFLLVDDNQHMRAIAAAILRSAGARHIREAADGAEALASLGRYPADIAIVDFKMQPMEQVIKRRLILQLFQAFLMSMSLTVRVLVRRKA
jgi:CheY-like chemotaxis protein